MFSYSKAAVERAMKVQEVILRAMAKKITWWQAAEIIGVSDRQMRRWHERYEEFGYDGLFDRRRRRQYASADVNDQRIPADQPGLGRRRNRQAHRPRSAQSLGRHVPPRTAEKLSAFLKEMLGPKCRANTLEGSEIWQKLMIFGGQDHSTYLGCLNWLLRTRFWNTAWDCLCGVDLIDWRGTKDNAVGRGRQ